MMSLTKLYKNLPQNNEYLKNNLKNSIGNTDIAYLNKEALSYDIINDYKVTCLNAYVTIQKPMTVDAVIMNVMSRCKHLTYDEIYIKTTKDYDVPNITKEHSVYKYLSKICNKADNFFNTQKSYRYINPMDDIQNENVTTMVSKMKANDVPEMVGYKDMVNAFVLEFQRSSVEALVSLIDMCTNTEALVLFVVEHKIMLILGLQTVVSYFWALHKEGYLIQFLKDVYFNLWISIFRVPNSIIIITQRVAIPVVLGTLFAFFQNVVGKYFELPTSIDDSKYVFEGKSGEIIAETGNTIRKIAYTIGNFLFEASDGFAKGLIYPKIQSILDILNNNPEAVGKITKKIGDVIEKK